MPHLKPALEAGEHHHWVIVECICKGVDVEPLVAVVSNATGRTMQNENVDFVLVNMQAPLSQGEGSPVTCSQQPPFGRPSPNR